jgi:hypothetical protein
MALLPVVVPDRSEAHGDERGPEQEQPPTTGAIHIELPGRALISVDSGADPALLRSILESLRK